MDNEPNRQVGTPSLVTFRVIEEYARARGINGLVEMQKFGMECATASSAMERTKCGWAGIGAHLALLFKYYDLSGVVREYCTARVIRGSSTFAEPVVRMMGPKGAPPQLWFSPSLDWASIPVGATVQYHESVIKAANATKNGYWAVGGNGVYGFSSKAHRMDLLPDFFDLPWLEKGLRFEIVLDSNCKESHPEYNYQVGAAITRLANVMAFHFRDLSIGIRYIPPVPDPITRPKGWGYDDWCMAGGGVFSGEPEAYEYRPSAGAIQHLNTKIAYVHGAKAVVGLEPPKLVYRDAEVRTKFANVTYADEEGVRHPAWEAWVRSELRNECKELKYAPGLAAWEPGEFINLWNGWGAVGKAGDISPLMHMLGNIFSAADATELLNWAAHIIQHPTAQKSTRVPVIVGEEGIGKSTFGTLLSKVVGEDNTTTIRAENLEEKFNSYALSHLVIIEDMAKIDAKHQNKLLTLATDEWVYLRRMRMDPYKIKNVANIMIITNDYDSLKINPESRRYYIMAAEEKEKRTPEYWVGMLKWVRSEGPGVLMDFLLHRDISSWDAYAPTPLTAAKREMAEAGHGGMYEFLLMLRDDSEPWFGGRSVATAKEIEVQYISWSGGSLELSSGRSKAIGQMMRKWFAQANGGNQLKVQGIPTRVWILKNTGSKWTGIEVNEDMARYPLVIKGKY